MRIVISYTKEGRNEQTSVNLPEAPNIGDEIGVLGHEMFLVRQRRWMTPIREGTNVEPYLVVLCERINA